MKWQIQNAKNRFSELVNKASQGKPQLVTKNGKPVAYVIDCSTYRKKIANDKHSKKSIIMDRPHKDIIIPIVRDKGTGRKVAL